MKYFIIDGELSGTGIRDKYTGIYIDPSSLNISNSYLKDLKDWLKMYEEEHYLGFDDFLKIEILDQIGKQLAIRLNKELLDVKVEYYSHALLKFIPLNKIS